MQYSFLGRTGVRVSQLAFGTMSFGGDADEATARAMYSRCREVGINLFDCADVYNGGEAERILGRLMKGCRNDLIITSKAYFPTSADVNARGSSRYHLVRAVEASLERLDTDRIDILFLHRFDEQTDLEQSLRAVDDLIRSGKVLYLGVSNFSAWQTMKAIGIAERRGFDPLVCLQPMYNLVKRQAEVELLPMAASEGLGVFPYSPLGGGLLTGKYGRERRPDSGRVVDNAMYATRYSEASYFDTAERFCALAAREGVHPVTLAVAWVASNPAVTAPLLGARHLEQLEPALAAASLSLSAELRDEISALSPEPPPATDRNEETSRHNYGSR